MYIYLLYKIVIYFRVFIFNCNCFLFSAFCFFFITLKRKNAYLCYMRANDSLRFCKFYGEIPIMRIARIIVLSKIKKIKRTRFFIRHLRQQPARHTESRKVNRTVVIRINKPDKLNEMNCVRLIPAP